MSLTATLRVQALADLVSALDLGSASAPLRKTYQAELGDGTGTGQANRIWHDQRTLAASANEDLDLAGSLLDALGGAFSLARVKGLIVAAAAGNTNNVIVGAAASNAWAALLGATHTLTVRPGAVVAAFAGAADPTGWAVTAGTGDLLRIANSGAGTSVTYDIVVVGASA